MHNIQINDLKAHFFDLSLDLFCVLDANGIIQTANPAFMRLMAIATDHVEGLAFTDIIYVEDREVVETALHDLSSLEIPLSYVCRLLCHDHTLKWFMWTVYAHSSGLFHAIGKDITPYKEMENKETERNIFAEALLDTVLAINSSLSLEEVLERILSNVGKVVAYDYVNIMLVEGEQAEIAGTQFRGPHHEDMSHLKNRKFSIQSSDYLSTMYHTQESLIVPEITATPVWMASSGLSTSGSFLGAPIIVEEEVIGFLGVFNVAKEYFTPLHAQQLITFANQAGSAIKNARLYEQAEAVAVLKERQRMAQELHDSVNQNLFAASTYADLLPRAIERKPEVVGRYASDISRLIRGAVAQMRMILIELHPDTLTKLDLSILIKQQCEAFSSHTGIPVNFNANQTTVLDRKDQIAVYRIAQEALHNIDKHAQATTVDIRLLINESELDLLIVDNGIGFDPDTITNVQFGVRGMHERAASIGAQIHIESQPQQGTKITLRKEYHAKS